MLKLSRLNDQGFYELFRQYCSIDDDYINKRITVIFLVEFMITVMVITRK